MSTSKRVHITENQGKWRGRREGADRASFTARTKEEAIEKDKDLAQKEQGQLIIHKRDGQIQEERTYGKDPFPPKG